MQVFLHASQDPAWKARTSTWPSCGEHGPHLPQPGDIRLMSETVVPVCSPALVSPGERDDPRVFARHRWLEEKHVDSPETSWDTWSARLGLDPSAAGAAGPERIEHRAAAAGVGIALGRAPLVDEELASGRLVPLMPHLKLAGSWGCNAHAAQPADGRGAAGAGGIPGRGRA